MPTKSHDPMKSTTARGEQIAVLHRAHAHELERRVARRGGGDEPTIEDACSFAWLQLLTHDAIELSCPQRLLAWLTCTATREAWRLQAIRAAERPLEHRLLADCDGPLASSCLDVDELVDHRARLELVAQVPERQRRFLMRIALGQSHREIASAERASLRTTSRQIVRARQRLRALESAADFDPRRAPSGDIAACDREAALTAL